MESEPSSSSRFSALDPRVFVTVTLIVIMFSVTTAIGFMGGGFLIPDLSQLVRFGGLAKPLVRDHYEYWRLATAIFLHGGFVHFFLNVLVLYYFGGWMEIILGRVRFLALFLAAGVAGNLVSLLWGPPYQVSVGASGGIFGIAVAYLIVEVLSAPHWTAALRQPSTRTLFFLIGINLAIGLLIPFVDSWAHLGGAATGALLGWFFLRPLRRPGPNSDLVRWLTLAVWATGITLMAEASLRPPDGVKSHIGMGLYYLESADRAEAFRHFDLAARAEPREAVAYLDQLARQFPRETAVAIAGEGLELLDVDREAADYYREQVGKQRSAEDYWLLIHLLKTPDLADYPGALAACADGRKRFAADYRWDMVEADIHAAFRQFIKALEALRYRRATPRAEAYPKPTSASLDAQYWDIAALCHVRLEQWPEADFATSRRLVLAHVVPPDNPRFPVDVQVLDWRYRTLRELGRTSEAVPLRRQLEKLWREHAVLAPDRAQGMNNLAWFLATHEGNLTEAEKLAVRAVEMLPHAAYLDTLAWVEHRRGRPEAAWRAMERALRRRRSDGPDILYHAAAILEALGRKDEAREFARRAVRPGLDFDEYEAAETLAGTKESNPRTTATLPVRP